MVSEKHHQRVTRHKEFLSPQNRRLTLWLIFFLAVLLRLFHFSLNSDNPLMYMPVLDEKYYVAFGQAVSGGALTGDNKEFFMDPLYGYFLAGIFFLCGDNLTTVRLIQIVVDALNVVLIYRVGRKVWKENAAITAAFGYAVYPVAFFYSLLILKTTLCTTMLLLFTLCLIYALEKEKGRWCWYGLGMLAGIMTQLRGNMLLLMPLVILMIPVWHWGGWYTFAQKSLLLVLGFLVVLSVGGIRNYWVRGTFTLLNTQSGRLFYSCNNPQNLTGRYNVPDFARPDPVLSEMDFHEEAERRKGISLSAGSASLYWMMETFRFLYHHPEAVFRLLFNKIKGTLGHCEIANNHSYYSAARFSPLLKWPVAPFAIVFSLGLPGLVLGMWRNRRVLVLLAPLLSVFLTILIFYTSSRFRMPAAPFFMIGAGITLSILLDGLKRRKIGKICLLVSLVALCGFSSLWVPCPKPSGTEDFLLAKAYWHQKDFEKASGFAFKGAEAFPSQARFHVLLGMIAFSTHQPDEAIQQNEQAIRLDPKNVDAFYNLGLIYLETERPEQAMRCFQAAGMDPP